MQPIHQHGNAPTVACRHGRDCATTDRKHRSAWVRREQSTGSTKHIHVAHSGLGVAHAVQMGTTAECTRSNQAEASGTPVDIIIALVPGRLPVCHALLWSGLTDHPSP